MLILSRRIKESIVISGAIEVTVLGVEGHRVVLGIKAPRSVQVDRLEVHERKRKEAIAPPAEQTVALHTT